MTKGDRPPIDVDLFNVQAKLTYTVDVHRSEGFVDLLSHIVNLHPGLSYWGGLPRIGPRPPWRFLPDRELLGWR